MNRLALVAGVLVLTACTPEPPPLPSSPPTVSQPATPEPVPRGKGESTPRSRELVELVRGAVPGSVRETADLARPVLDSTQYRAGVLVDDGGGRFGAVSVVVDEPVITSGEARCQPPVTRCTARKVDGGTVLVTDNREVVLLEFYRTDGTAPLRVLIARLVTGQDSLFWQGGGRAERLPIDVEAGVRLAERVNSAF